MIAAAALMWGLIGFFVKGLSAAGLSPMEIVALRAGTAVVILLAIGLVKFRRHLKIKGGDLPLFIGTGWMSIVFFNWCYFTAIEKMNIPVAAALLYTSPAFVIALSVLFLKEKLNAKKLFAVAGTIAGCALAAGVSLGAGSSFPPASIVIGLGAGLGYALYSIFGKVALNRYHPFTVTFYTFIMASVLLIPVLLSGGKAWASSGEVYLYSIGLGLFPTVIAYFAYSWGLEKTESSRAAIIATVEPVAALILGISVFHESITVAQGMGIAVILASVILVNLPERRSRYLNHKKGKSAPQ
jgi:drug/metabolite transporter (DMT)-like permease